jgi:hypothetical protein
MITHFFFLVRNILIHLPSNKSDNFTCFNAWEVSKNQLCIILRVLHFFK